MNFISKICFTLFVLSNFGSFVHSQSVCLDLFNSQNPFSSHTPIGSVSAHPISKSLLAKGSKIVLIFEPISSGYVLAKEFRKIIRENPHENYKLVAVRLPADPTSELAQQFKNEGVFDHVIDLVRYKGSDRQIVRYINGLLVGHNVISAIEASEGAVTQANLLAKSDMG